MRKPRVGLSQGPLERASGDAQGPPKFKSHLQVTPGSWPGCWALGLLQLVSWAHVLRSRKASRLLALTVAA